MTTRAALIQEKGQQRLIDADLHGGLKSGALQSSLALLRPWISGGARVTSHARRFASAAGVRRAPSGVVRTYPRPLEGLRGQRARRVETNC